MYANTTCRSRHEIRGIQATQNSKANFEQVWYKGQDQIKEAIMKQTILPKQHESLLRKMSTTSLTD